MTKLEKLHDYAYGKDIKIYEIYHDSDIKGCCMVDDDSAILINKTNIKNSHEEICILAEEMGHLQTGAILPCEDYINPGYKKWLKRKNEIWARRWALNEILPPEEIQNAIDRHCTTMFEIAEECTIDIEYVVNAIEYYNNQGMNFNCGER